MDEDDKRSIWQSNWVLGLGPLVVALTVLLLVFTLEIGGVLYALVTNVDTETDGTEAIRGIGWLFGALVGGFVAIGFGMWRGVILEKQTKVSRDQYERSLERDYADLFTKAVEQLGATREERIRDAEGNEVYTYKRNIEVRLGAIYALERVSRDSERDHIAVMETLCAYVRENAPVEEGTDFEPPEQEEGLEGEALREWWRDIYKSALRAWLGTVHAPRADIQAVLTVLGRRDESRVAFEVGPDENKPRYRLDLRNADLRKADMREGDFRRALFTEARMQGAYLYQARMQGADLRHARMQGADLRHARMQGADLEHAQMQGAVLRHARMQGADLRHARMQGADLYQARMQGADLRHARMQGAYLYQARMQGADLRHARMQGADLTDAQMQGAVLRDARMQGADLEHAQMQGADLYQARMQGADLTDAHLKSAKLAMVRIDSAIASFADFTDAEDLSQEAIDSSFGCAGTMLPEGVSRPGHWHPEELDFMEHGGAYEAWKNARAANKKPPWVDESDWAGWDGGA